MEKISYLIHAYPCSRPMCGPDPHRTSSVQPSIVGTESIPTERGLQGRGMQPGNIGMGLFIEHKMSGSS